MNAVEDLLISTLETLGYPVRLQGSLFSNTRYPDHFFTYWNDAADGGTFYDDDERTIVWQYSVNIYSIDPLIVTNKLLEAKKALKEAGFIVHGAGYAVMSDEPTHTGRGITVLYRQKI